MLARPLSPIAQRLLPLYISAFLQSIPFWYAIEKLFMTSIGFDTASIGLMVAIMSATMLAVETPSGILADRWSRKGVMFLGLAALILSGIIGGFSYNEPAYIISTIFWGTYAALYSGTYDSVIYDTVMEEHGSSKRYEYFLGRLHIVEAIGFVIGALAGGVLASNLGMRETYFISLPLLALGGFYLLRFREPTLHKAEESVPVLAHIQKTFAAVLRKRVLLPIVVATVGFAVLLEVLLEMSQLWFIAISTPLGLYGVISACLFSTWALGGMMVGKVRMRGLFWAAPAVVLMAILGLVVGHGFWIILFSQFILGASLVALGIVLSRMLHDELPSSVRAGSSSVISTIGRTLLIPGILLFTLIAQEHSVFYASYLLLITAVVSVIAFVFIPKKTSSAVL